MSNTKLPAPENFCLIPKDSAVTASYSAVKGASGYVLKYFNAANPGKCIKVRYAQGRSKTILGFKNGVKYLAQVQAFSYAEDGSEILGIPSVKQAFIPISMELKSPKKICLSRGDTCQLRWEYKNTVPTVEFCSSDESVAVVSADGTVTAVGAGNAEIIITMKNGMTAATSVSVERCIERLNNDTAVIMLTGDLMCAVGHQRSAADYSFDFSESFTKIAHLMRSADLRIGVLETMCRDNAPYECEEVRTPTGSPNCNSPSTFIGAMKGAGYDVLVTANNHNCDTGITGLEDTVRLIKRAGIKNSGTLGDNPIFVDVKGIKIAIISCCMVSNGLEKAIFAEDEYHRIGKYTPESFCRLCDSAKTVGAEYIIAYQHWGTMNSSAVRKAQTDAAQQMADAGADFIVGSHPHVMQRFDYITAADGRIVPCAYSMGNFLTTMRELRENRESAILKLKVKRHGNGLSSAVSYIPTICTVNDRGAVIEPVFPSQSALHQKSCERIAAQLGDKINCDSVEVVSMYSQCMAPLFENNPQYAVCALDNVKSDSAYVVVDFYNIAQSAEDISVKMAHVKHIADTLAGIPACRIVLIRLYMQYFGKNYSQLNDELHALEQRFIETVNPCVIDVSRYYFFEGERFERYFYNHIDKLLGEIMQGMSHKFYFAERDEMLWLQRVIRYYDTMQQTDEWLLMDDEAAADYLIKRGGQLFAAQYMTELLYLKREGFSAEKALKDDILLRQCGEDFSAEIKKLI